MAEQLFEEALPRRSPTLSGSTLPLRQNRSVLGSKNLKGASNSPRRARAKWKHAVSGCQSANTTAAIWQFTMARSG